MRDHRSGNGNARHSWLVVLGPQRSRHGLPAGLTVILQPHPGHETGAALARERQPLAERETRLRAEQLVDVEYGLHQR